MKQLSNQENVQRAIARLSNKRRQERAAQDKVRLLQLKLYLKVKQATCEYFKAKLTWKPYAGKPHVRFEEGKG
mgnify:CR=1 FL=1